MLSLIHVSMPMCCSLDVSSLPIGHHHLELHLEQVCLGLGVVSVDQDLEYSVKFG